MSRHRAPSDDDETDPPLTFSDTAPVFVGDVRAAYDAPPGHVDYADQHARANHDMRARGESLASRYALAAREAQADPALADPQALADRAVLADREAADSDAALADDVVDTQSEAPDVAPDDHVDELGLLAAEPVSSPAPRGRRNRDPGRQRRRPLAIVASLGVIAVLVAGIFFGGKAIVELIDTEPAADYSGQGSGTVQIEVPPGASTVAIAGVLVDNDVVASAQAFVDAATANPDALGIQPGVYEMRMQMSGAAALAWMLDPASKVFERATIPEGYTVAATLESLAEQTGISLTEFQSAAAATDQLGLPIWANGLLEGFLYPATYDVFPDATAAEVLADMVAQFNQVATETGLEAAAAAAGLTPYQALTVASLVQAEVTVESERPQVARVIYNRLTRDIPLGIDAALAYELGVSGSELTTEVLQRDSPYNTRIRLGLPPTPISNPGQPSMVGAVQPVAGPWLYYVLQSSDGTHFFTESYDEFVAAKAECERQGLGCG